MNQTIEKRAYSLKETAVSLGVSTITIRRYLASGMIQGFRTGIGGHWRIPTEEIDRFIREQLHREHQQKLHSVNGGQLS